MNFTNQFVKEVITDLNFKDVKALIANKPEFKVYSKSDYYVVDYVITMPETFKGNSDKETLILQQLRGITFSQETGEIVSLPYHKFHNLNETEGYLSHQVDLNKAESITVKMDGSMIRCIKTKSNKRGWVFGTRAGETEVSALVDKWLDSKSDIAKQVFEHRVSLLLELGVYPIFEFVSRKNKVVIDYPEDKLVLLDCRFDNGLYASKRYVESQAYSMAIVDSVKNYIGVDELSDSDLVNKIRNEKSIEGVVVSFESYKKVKIKADDYVRMHRAKDLVRLEKDIVKLILEDKLDDVLPILDQDLKDSLLNYKAKLLESIAKFEHKLSVDYMTTLCKSSRVEFAKSVQTFVNEKRFHKYFYRMFDNKDMNVAEVVLSACSSGPTLADVLNSHGLPRWVQETVAE